MEKKNYLGVWMDYSTANLIDSHQYDETLHSGITPEMKDEAYRKGEKHLHQKEQQLLKEYFREIASRINDYDEVLLFGPTHAKTELQHFLEKEKSVEQVKLFVETTDKMTVNQKNAFVKKFFNP